MSTGPRVVVAAPAPVLLAGVRSTLQDAGCQVVGEAGSWAQLLESVQTEQPDAVLVDDALPGDLGAGIRTLLRQAPGVPVLVMTDHHADSALLAAVRAGARGYLVTDIDIDQLANAVVAVAAGQAVVPRRFVGYLLDEMRRTVAPDRQQREGPRLTEREQQVLDLLRSGWSTARIASELYVAPVTVRTHVAAIMHKMHVTDRRALLSRPSREGVVAEPERQAPR